MIQLLIGGVRSGKSDAAENLLIQQLADNPSLHPAYIATSVAFGEETISRIQQHQKTRQSRFPQVLSTYELDYKNTDLLSVLNLLNTPNHILLIECLSTWVGWYLSVNKSLHENLLSFEQQKESFLSFLQSATCDVIIVSGEVGCGLIGETPLQRRYADQLGELNQQVATLADRVFVVTAGIKQLIK
ncbi:bifunctional adenosylcobinamide kinase/adenosylcobinamide-phosphate guanylyltransferase [Psychromonas algarum]|uniref:bifunctional adenosylcobinamide kinase/adenosylcobinamide-phosphate guanylyltransferase n=1 Tax=Psychromonas algarum TaxID=2555643 RepID=UPI00141999D9|nr:bifunctional adenosylcobinamide kinase/adenosylcobinamide-phosphate guanylyltransferase [Psychromonas sp. RZ22]